MLLNAFTAIFGLFHYIITEEKLCQGFAKERNGQGSAADRDPSVCLFVMMVVIAFRYVVTVGVGMLDRM